MAWLDLGELVLDRINEDFGDLGGLIYLYNLILKNHRKKVSHTRVSFFIRNLRSDMDDLPKEWNDRMFAFLRKHFGEKGDRFVDEIRLTRLLPPYED